MPGRLPGRVFKNVIKAMLDGTAATLFPQIKRHIADMDPEGLYPWDDFTDMMQTVAAKLPSEALVTIGRQIILGAREQVVADGLSGDGLLKDWGNFFNRRVRGAPARDMVRTEAYEPGRVTILAGVAQPARLIEGYVRGVVEVFELGQVTSCEITPVVMGGSSYNRLVVRWE